MKLLLPIALLCVMSAHAQRGGMGGVRGGMGGGFRGGMGSPGIGRGFAGGGMNRGFAPPAFRGFGGVNRGFGWNRGIGYNRGFFGGANFGLGLGLGWGGWGWGWNIGNYGCPYSYPCSSYVTYPYVGGYWPGYSDVPVVNYGYNTYRTAQSPVTVVYPPQPTPLERARPVTREYDEFGQAVQPPAPGNASPIYLFAFQDGVIRAASSYRVDGATLRYVTLDREEKEAAIETLDRALTLQLNRERRVRVQIP